MIQILEDLFYDWSAAGIILWLVISLGSIYVFWFVPIPSLSGDSEGFPELVKWVIPVIIPVVTWYLINNKEWTANTFSKGRR